MHAGPNRLAALRVASRGYAASGVGSEIPVGAGVVGVAVREGTPIRLSRLTSAYAYGRAIRKAAAREGLHFETEIPFPGRVAPRSQLAVPIRMAGEPVTVRHYPADNSVFLGDDYLIKGVAGAVFWALVSDHVNDGRTAFSNRELRLDPRICLPEVGDNLEARLVLLQRRLVERHACVRIEKSGRGRFGLRVERPLRLTQVG